MSQNPSNQSQHQYSSNLNGLNQQYQYYHIKNQNKINPFHLIFAIDSSGSMMGNSWKQLIIALKSIFDQLASNQQNNTIKISLLQFNQVSKVVYKRNKPCQINFNNVLFLNGGTQFQPLFKDVFEIACENIQYQKVIFIFMTDGSAYYPSTGINNLKQLMNNHPKKFIYTSILLGEKNQILDKIASDLKGKCRVVHYPKQLLAAYKQIIYEVIK